MVLLHRFYIGTLSSVHNLRAKQEPKQQDDKYMNLTYVAFQYKFYFFTKTFHPYWTWRTLPKYKSRTCNTRVVSDYQRYSSLIIRILHTRCVLSFCVRPSLLHSKLPPLRQTRKQTEAHISQRWPATQQQHRYNNSCQQQQQQQQQQHRPSHSQLATRTQQQHCSNNSQHCCNNWHHQKQHHHPYQRLMTMTTTSQRNERK